ncbi:MAG: hypothetical protein AAGI53_10025 [Planctomycetota bacterium]
MNGYDRPSLAPAVSGTTDPVMRALAFASPAPSLGLAAAAMIAIGWTPIFSSSLGAAVIEQMVVLVAAVVIMVAAVAAHVASIMDVPFSEMRPGRNAREQVLNVIALCLAAWLPQRQRWVGRRVIALVESRVSHERAPEGVQVTRDIFLPFVAVFAVLGGILIAQSGRDGLPVYVFTGPVLVLVVSVVSALLRWRDPFGERAGRCSAVRCSRFVTIPLMSPVMNMVVVYEDGRVDVRAGVVRDRRGARAEPRSGS